MRRQASLRNGLETEVQQLTSKCRELESRSREAEERAAQSEQVLAQEKSRCSEAVESLTAARSKEAWLEAAADVTSCVHENSVFIIRNYGISAT